MSDASQIESNQIVAKIQGPIGFAIKGKDVVAFFFWLIVSMVLIFLVLVGISFSVDEELFAAWENATLLATGYVVYLVWFLLLKSTVVDGGNRSWEALGFRACASEWNWLGVVAFLALLGVSTAIQTYVDVDPDGRLEDYLAEMSLYGESLTFITMELINVGPLTALIEEAIFRGVLFGWLHQNMRFIPAAMISSVIFGVIHFEFLDPGGVLGFYYLMDAIAIGFVMAYLFERSGSLWPAVVLHAVNNIYFTIYMAFVPLETILGQN